MAIHGIYHWRPRRTAFRNDYCRACGAQTVSALVRTWDVLHLYWIPLLPIGVWSRWHCTRCAGRPHAATKVRLGFKIAGALLLALMTWSIWVTVPQSQEASQVFWVVRIGLLIPLAFAIYAIFKHRPEPKLDEQLATVPPFEGRTCPLCGGELLSTPELVCAKCGAQHRPLKRHLPLAAP